MRSTGVPGNSSEISAAQMVLCNIISSQTLCTRILCLTNIPEGKEDGERKDPAISGRMGISRPGYNGTGKINLSLSFFGLPSFSNVIIRLQR